MDLATCKTYKCLGRGETKHDLASIIRQSFFNLLPAMRTDLQHIYSSCVRPSKPKADKQHQERNRKSEK